MFLILLFGVCFFAFTSKPSDDSFDAYLTTDPKSNAVNTFVLRTAISAARKLGAFKIEDAILFKYVVTDLNNRKCLIIGAFHNWFMDCHNKTST